MVSKKRRVFGRFQKKGGKGIKNTRDQVFVCVLFFNLFNYIQNKLKIINYYT
jgi:hypothetical protein